MDDGDSKNQKQIFRKEAESGNIQRYDFVPRSILQSIWIRCSSVFPNITDRKFMESELRYVLYCGIIFWIAYLLSQAF